MAKEKVKEPQYFRSAINNPTLNYKVYVMNTSEKILYFCLIFIAGGLVGEVFYGGLFKTDGIATFATYISDTVVFCLIGLIAAKIFIPIIAESLRKKRLSRMKLQFRDFLTALSNSIAGGMNVNDSIKNARNDLVIQYSEDSYIVKEINELIVGMENNVSLEEMLVDLGNRSGDDDILNFATVFNMCYRSGGNLKEVMKRTTDIISTRIAISQEIETKLTSNKVQFMAMEAIPIVLMLMMKFMSSDFAESFTSVTGVISITLGVGLFVAAYMVAQKIMTIKG